MRLTVGHAFLIIPQYFNVHITIGMVSSIAIVTLPLQLMIYVGLGAPAHMQLVLFVTHLLKVHTIILSII